MLTTRSFLHYNELSLNLASLYSHDALARVGDSITGTHRLV